MRSSAASSHDPEAIRRLTDSYRSLRGLTWLPLALWFLVRHLDGLLGMPLGRGATLVLAIPAAAAALAIGRHYDRRFGVVTNSARWSAGTWLLLLIAFVTLQVTSAYLALPIQLGFLAIGAAIAVYAFRHFKLKGQRLLFAVPFIVMSFLSPIWPPFFDDAPVRSDSWFYAAAVAFDAIWIMVALLDHRALVKAFERTRLAGTG